MRGCGFEGRVVVVVVHDDLNDDDERRWLSQKCAEDYRSNGGYEDRGWMEGEHPLKFWIWLDKDTKFGYNVWCELSPTFYTRP